MQFTRCGVYIYTAVATGRETECVLQLLDSLNALAGRFHGSVVQRIEVRNQPAHSPVGFVSDVSSLAVVSACRLRSNVEKVLLKVVDIYGEQQVGVLRRLCGILVRCALHALPRKMLRRTIRHAKIVVVVGGLNIFDALLDFGKVKWLGVDTQRRCVGQILLIVLSLKAIHGLTRGIYVGFRCASRIAHVFRKGLAAGRWFTRHTLREACARRSANGGAAST